MRRFTLIELLGVVAIIGILASRLLPVLTKSRQAARITACISQVKQLGTANSMFADDNDDRITRFSSGALNLSWVEWPNTPKVQTWERWSARTFINDGYLEERVMWYCPMDQNISLNSDGSWPSWGITSYNFNPQLLLSRRELVTYRGGLGLLRPDTNRTPIDIYNYDTSEVGLYMDRLSQESSNTRPNAHFPIQQWNVGKLDGSVQRSTTKSSLGRWLLDNNWVTFDAAYDLIIR